MSSDTPMTVGANQNTHPGIAAWTPAGDCWALMTRNAVRAPNQPPIVALMCVYHQVCLSVETDRSNRMCRHALGDITEVPTTDHAVVEGTITLTLSPHEPVVLLAD